MDNFDEVVRNSSEQTETTPNRIPSIAEVYSDSNESDDFTNDLDRKLADFFAEVDSMEFRNDRLDCHSSIENDKHSSETSEENVAADVLATRTKNSERQIALNNISTKIDMKTIDNQHSNANFVRNSPFTTKRKQKSIRQKSVNTTGSNINSKAQSLTQSSRNTLVKTQQFQYTIDQSVNNKVPENIQSLSDSNSDDKSLHKEYLSEWPVDHSSQSSDESISEEPHVLIASNINSVDELSDNEDKFIHVSMSSNSASPSSIDTHFEICYDNNAISNTQSMCTRINSICKLILSKLNCLDPQKKSISIQSYISQTETRLEDFLEGGLQYEFALNKFLNMQNQIVDIEKEFTPEGLTLMWNDEVSNYYCNRMEDDEIVRLYP
ncbi:hypothetical protein GJ496_008531, partial [Pomphorhynchus laevis]